MTGVRWYQWIRIAFALLTLAAVMYQLTASWDRESFRLANFLSYFTIQSNLLAAGAMLVGAWLAIKGRETTPGWELIRGATVSYMATTGIVFAALLAGLSDELDLTEPWVDYVLHTLYPIVVVLDWVLAAPRHRLTLRRALPWMLYPLAYCLYSLIRGPGADWYPYPFLNPDEVGGYAGVAAYAVGIAIFFVGLTWALVAIGNWARDWWQSRAGALQPVR